MLKSLFKKTLDVRPGEYKRLAIMSAYMFVIITAYNVLKPMTRSLFVATMGLRQMPLLYIIVAVVVGLFVLVYMKASARLRLDKLINFTTVLLILTLLGFWWLLQIEVKSFLLYYGLFIWASIFGVLTTTQFWLLANYVFNAREAKRLFSTLTAFALTGGIVGGYAAGFLVTQIGGTANLSFICIGLLLLTLLCSNLAWHHRDQSIETTRRVHPQAMKESGLKIVGEVFGLIKSSRHLAYLMGIVALTFLVVQITDFQFVAYASEETANTDELTGFLGFWLSNLSVVALVFQLLFANLILDRLGVGVTIMVLPLTLFFTSAWVFLSYGLFSIISVQIADGTFRYSIYKVGTELLFLPLPAEVKKKTKAFIDMFVDRFGRGLAGVMLLVFYSVLGLTVAQISLVSMAVIVLWVLLSVLSYREYVNSFRKAIARRNIDLEAVSLSIKDQATIDSLIISLASKNERQVVYALQLLQSVKGVDLVPPIKPLLSKPSADVRYGAAQVAYHHELKSLVNDVRPLLQDDDERVRCEAVRIVAEFSENSTESIISNWIACEDKKLRAGALRYLAENADLAEELLTPGTIRSFANGNPDERSQIAVALGILKNKQTYPYLHQLLQDSDVEVKTQAIRSAGLTTAKEFVPTLIQNLDKQPFRKVTREALAHHGDSVAGELAQALQDESLSLFSKINITRTLSLIGSQRTVDVLLTSLAPPNEALRYHTIKALNKLRKNFPELSFDRRVDRALLDELKRYFRILTSLHMSDKQEENEQTSRSGLLKRALQERLDDHLERIFRLLGLRYPPKDIYNAFAATVSSNRASRANAIEFLDNILQPHHKRLLLPVVEDLPVEQVLLRANGYLDVQITSREEALKMLVEGDDPWLKTCALYDIGETGRAAQFQPQIQAALQSKNTFIRETAELLSKQFT